MVCGPNKGDIIKKVIKEAVLIPWFLSAFARGIVAQAQPGIKAAKALTLSKLSLEELNFLRTHWLDNLVSIKAPKITPAKKRGRISMLK